MLLYQSPVLHTLLLRQFSLQHQAFSNRPGFSRWQARLLVVHTTRKPREKVSGPRNQQTSEKTLRLPPTRRRPCNMIHPIIMGWILLCYCFEMIAGVWKRACFQDSPLVLLWVCLYLRRFSVSICCLNIHSVECNIGFGGMGSKLASCWLAWLVMVGWDRMDRMDRLDWSRDISGGRPL